MATFIRVLLTLLLCNAPVLAESLGNLSLADVVSAAGQHQAGSHFPAEGSPYQSSSWLAALPSLGVSYLASDSSQGTDETELSLHLPFKSSRGRKFDSQLRALVGEIQSTESMRRRLYLSGLVRETLWSQRLALTRGEYSQKKVTLLQNLLQRQQDLFAARSASGYSVLLIRQELTDARIREQEALWEAQKWTRRYTDLSGIASLPEDISELPLPGAPQFNQHPELHLLDLSWQRQQAVIAAGSSSATPWTVSLTAKQLDNIQMDENQYGVAVDIPLSIFDLSSEATRAGWQEASRSYWQSRDELQLTLKQRYDALASEASFLQRQQVLLQESSAISEQLMTQTQQLKGLNELGHEIWVRRLLGDIDKRADAAINQLLIGQNRAMTRQAAGIPL